MKIKKTCSYCNKSYDYYEEKCPYCNEVNNDEEVINSRHIPMVKIWKQIAYFLIGSAGFQVLALLLSLVLVAINKPSNPDEKLLYSSLLNFISYGLLFVIFCFVTWKDYKKLFKSFYLLKWKPYVFAIAGVVAIFAFNLAYNNFLSLVGYTPQINENESSIRTIVNSYPVVSILIFGIVGPICEELTYRVGLFSFLRRIHISLAYVGSALIFASIHFSFASIGTSAFIDELVAIVPYIFSGVTFGFLYHKFGLASSLSAHVTNNLISLLSTIASSSKILIK